MGIPFELADQEQQFIEIALHVNDRPITKTMNGTMPVTLFFDHPEFKLATINLHWKAFADEGKTPAIQVDLPEM